MSKPEQDEFDKIAADALPCYVNDDGEWCSNGHHDEMCPNRYRPAVAAKMREMGEHIEVLKRNCEIERETFEADQKQIADLRAENERLSRCKNSVVEAMVMFPNVGEYVAQIEAERDQLKAELAACQKSNKFQYGRIVELKKQEDDYLRATSENAQLKAERAEAEKRAKYYQTPTCIMLGDGNKVVLRRDGERAWLEVVPQVRVELAELEKLK